MTPPSLGTLGISVLILAAGCGDSRPQRVTPAEATPIDPATTGTVEGIVEFLGSPPPNPEIDMGECRAYHGEPVYQERVLVKGGRLRNAFVYVSRGLESYRFATPDVPVVVRNEKCLFVPRVCGAMVHQTIRFTNEDTVSHNVHTTGPDAFNVGLPGKGSVREVCLHERRIMVPLYCSFHGWMTGWIGVVEHPKFHVTGEDGTFRLEGLPAGVYTIEAWHETLGTRGTTVTVAAGETSRLVFRFSP